MSTQDLESEIEEYRSTHGADTRVADIASDGHALKQQFGSSEDAKAIEYDPEIAGERFVQWYDDTAASIREYLSNAETACIRRAKNELQDAGIPVPSNTAEMLAKAKDHGYEPTIEVTYKRRAEDTRLTIEDNGVGISVKEYLVLKKIGYSTSHSDGDRLGQFGMGFMSGFQLTGVEEPFRMYTRSRLTDETYSVECNVANFDYLDGTRDTYGTMFEFPTFCPDAEDVDVRSKVAEFCEAMRVPVLYREYDESGDQCFNEDYLPRNIEDDYDDGSLVVVYEDEFFKAVMSPNHPGRGRVTYNISMPIKRNDSQYGTKSYNAPWDFDFRGKEEDGPIVDCSDDSLVGKKPVSDNRYARIPEEKQDSHVRKSRVPDDAIVMPQPASSRDTYMSDHQAFWKYVSRKLVGAWADLASERFEQLDSWDEFESMSLEEKNGLIRAYDHFGPYGTDVDWETVQEEVEESTGVTLSKEVCIRLPELQRSVNVVNNGSTSAHRKSATRSRRVWKFLDDHDGPVYMGVSVSQKKAEIAWDLGGEIVRLDNSGQYSLFEDVWGWKKLKSLPNSDFSDLDVSDEIEEKWGNTANTNNTKSTGGNGRDPESARIRVRSGTSSRKKFTVHSVDRLVDQFEDKGYVNAGYNHANRVVLFDQNNNSVSQAAYSIDKTHNVAVALVPQYVYEYLIDFEWFYDSLDEVRQENKDADVGGEMLSDLTEDDVVLCYSTSVYDGFSDDEMCTALDLDYNRVFQVDPETLEGSWNQETDADVYTDQRTYTLDYDHAEKHTVDKRTIVKRLKTGHLDNESDEYKALFRNNGYSDDQLFHLIQIWNRIDADSPDSQEYEDIFVNNSYRLGNEDLLDRLVEIAEEAGL